MSNDTSALRGIGSVAQEKFFNDAFRRRNGKPFDGEPNDLVERQFQTFEDDFIRMREVAHAVMLDERAGTLDERQAMSFCMAVQLLRTAKMRDRLIDELVARSTSGPLTRWLRPDLRARACGDAEFVREHASLLQASIMWNSELIPEITCELYHYLWVIARNETPFPFYTSDAAFASFMHGAGQPPFYADPGRPRSFATIKHLFCGEREDVGLELIFPVSPKCAILMFSPEDFAKSLGDRQGNVLVVGGDTALMHNVAIAGQARRQVFGTTEDFTMARHVREQLYSQQ